MRQRHKVHKSFCETKVFFVCSRYRISFLGTCHDHQRAAQAVIRKTNTCKLALNNLDIGMKWTQFMTLTFLTTLKANDIQFAILTFSRIKSCVQKRPINNAVLQIVFI